MLSGSLSPLVRTNVVFSEEVELAPFCSELLLFLLTFLAGVKATKQRNSKILILTRLIFACKVHCNPQINKFWLARKIS